MLSLSLVRAILASLLLTLAALVAAIVPSHAQTLSASNVQIEWQVTNRFRFFRDAETFRVHERAWRQYLIHVDQLRLADEARDEKIANSSVQGIERVLNDRFITFSRILRTKYDAAGWAARQVDDTCWDPKSRSHAACNGVENYVEPKAHEVEFRLKPRKPIKLLGEYNCDWRIGANPPITAPCDDPITTVLPYPEGAQVSVNVQGEAPIETFAKVKDLLIIGLGDSFASGEGNPDVPVRFDSTRRFKNHYPRRARDDAGGNAQWLDELCHRSLYGHQLRAALQVAIENPRSAVTFMGYACSGAAVEEGILGPQKYVGYVSRSGEADPKTSIMALKGGRNDAQLRWLLRELCRDKPAWKGGQWICPGGNYRRRADLLLLSIGGNDIGFSNLVTWATLRDTYTASLAGLFGAAISANTFSNNMKDDLPGAYAKLARALERAVPLAGADLAFDARRVILTAYPDILEDENGNVCPSGEEGEREDSYAANQSLDMFRDWLVVTPKKLNAAHAQLEKLHIRMGELAEDHGWTFAGRTYSDKPFRGRGFCAQSAESRRVAVSKQDPADTLMIPCWGTASRETKTCETDFTGKVRGWRHYDPVTQHYPYALRQRWVRTFNDAYMLINEKVVTRSGKIDEEASAAIFSETTGAMHPSAEGHAAMADAILLDIRPLVAELLQADP